jgi:ribonuclease Z
MHCTAAQAASIANGAHAKQLVIGHFSARIKDENSLLEEAKSIFPNTLLACEGLDIDIF